MDTIHDDGGGASNKQQQRYQIRRASEADLGALTALISRAGGPGMYRKLFGSYNFASMIECGYLCLIALVGEEIAGFLSLSDAPRAGGAEEWLAWFAETYAPADADARPANTLWVEFAVDGDGNGGSSGGGGGGAVEQMMRKVFTLLPEVDSVAAALPPETAPPPYLFPAFAQLRRSPVAGPVKGDELFDGGPVLYCDRVGFTPTLLFCDRVGFTPTLAVRAACIEDHDDLLPIFEQQSEALTQTYGEFYLADVISAQDDQNRALVALTGQRACGLMSASSSVDVALLQRCFELQAYDRLVKRCFELQPYDCLVKIPEDVKTAFVAHRRKELGLDRVDHTVEARQVTKILIVGPPGSGKTTLAMNLAQRLGLAVCSVAAEAARAAEAGDTKGERALKLLNAGEEVPLDTALALVGPRLAGRECQQNGWVLEGGGLSCTADELEEAIVMATAVGQEDDIVARPDIVIALRLKDDAATSVKRVLGRRLDPETGALFSANGPLPESKDVASRLVWQSGDKEEAAVRARLEAHRAGIDAFLHTYLAAGGAASVGYIGGDAPSEDDDEDSEADSEAGGARGGAGGGAQGAAAGAPLPEKLLAHIVERGGTLGCVHQCLDAALHALVAVNEADTKGEEGGVAEPDWAALPPNAFAVTLFCLEEQLQSRAVDFLPHMFRMFPDRDYCVLTVPCAPARGVMGGPVRGASAPLLRHFAPARAKPDSAFGHALYVMHRDRAQLGIRDVRSAGSLRVRACIGLAFGHALYVIHRDSLPAYKFLRVARFHGGAHRLGTQRIAQYSDEADAILAAVQRIAQHSDEANATLAAVQRAEQHEEKELADNPPQCAFVAMLGRQVVGVLVADRAACGVDELAEIKARYQVEDLVNYERHRPRNHAMIAALVMDPLFAGHSRFFLKEVMRLYDKTVLYWTATPRAAVPDVVVWHMLPARPRRLPQLLNTDGDEAQSALPGGALYAMGRRDLTRRRAAVHARVLVVGGGACALACLEGLAFAPRARLTGLALITPGGLQGLAFAPHARLTGPALITPGGLQSDPDPAKPVDLDAPDADLLGRLSLETHVRVVDGRVVDLDRENKAVLLPDGTIAPYDLLVLCTGRQDATAQRLGLWTRGQDPACPLRARGYLSLDIANLDGHITELLSEIRSRGGGGGVLVYGNSLKALTLPGGGGSGGSAAAAAAEADAAAKRTRYPPAAAPAIVAAINEELARAGVKTVAGFELASVKVDDKARVCGAVLEKRSATKWEAKTADNRAETLHRDCRLVLAGDAENVDPDTFQAVLQSGLVYDGRLVVDLSCRTVDPSIYAAGTLTKFSRAFKRASHTHDQYSSRELGTLLAEQLLSAVNPQPNQAPPLERPPKFNCPRGVYARLPGGYHYLHANAPPPLSPPLAADGKASTGGVKVYCRANVDALGHLCELECYGRDPADAQRLFALVGLHQACMKDFAGRVAAGQVQDLAAFFHQDAFTVLSHDRFKQLAADLRAALERDGGGHDLVAALNGAMDEGRDDEWVGAAITDAVAAGALPPLTRKVLQSHVEDFVRKNRGTLPAALVPQAAPRK
ncbi:hypothetical protein JKP88DRAFT_286546 [Tribonema minus]|uniref:AAA+ ATPase domain-containing protein n=1 Tax=Tribonema minus TaxID=303371 RepID=A0A835ZCT4_9STRA|nr:hypothetical protein JKP88DRAFT_286546 [Tribonema minus]